jgi:hypothetical protein
LSYHPYRVAPTITPPPFSFFENVPTIIPLPHFRFLKMGEVLWTQKFGHKKRGN